MSPSLATLACVVGVIGLFVLDRDSKSRASLALWLPILWLFIGGSRNVSTWLAGGTIKAEDLTSGAEYLEGSPFDRNVLLLLIVLALGVLAARKERTLELLKNNKPLVIFVLYSVASTLWSDFPFVALKRWTKMLGNVAMGLVVLTELDPAAAVKRLLAATTLLWLPASILLIKYYPEFGRIYDRWEGKALYSGVAVDKNLLGCICMIMAFGTLSRFVEMFRSRLPARRVLVVGTLFAMNLWLFALANSATALGCTLVGGSVIVVLGFFTRPRPYIVHAMVTGMISLAAVAYLFPNVWAMMVGALGRNTTLTGRTDIWADVLAMDTRPWFGAGFESFFLGDRLTILWAKYWWHPNESHNGYLETYLTLGLVGVGLLAMLMVTGYRNAIQIYRRDPISGLLRLAFLIVSPIYNLTEAAFKVTGPLWILFLMVIVAMPELQPEESEVTEPEASRDSNVRNPGRRSDGVPEFVWRWRPPAIPGAQPLGASRTSRL